MKTIRSRSALGLICAMILLTCGTPAFSEGLWDVTLEMGGTVVQNPDLKDGGELEFDPGFGLSLSGTYRCQPWLRVGAELGFLVNYIDSFGENRPYSDADMFQMPMMLNVIIEPPQPWVVKPYAGAGVGGVLSVLSSRQMYYEDWYYYYGDYDSDTEIGWAAQVFAGIDWHAAETWTIGLKYHFIAAQGETWVFHDFNPGVDRYYTADTDDLMTHLITLTGTFKF